VSAIGTDSARAIAIACSTSAMPAQTGEGSAQDFWPEIKSRRDCGLPQGTACGTGSFSHSNTLTTSQIEPSGIMNSKEILPQNTAAAGGENQFTRATLNTSSPLECTRCSSEGARATNARIDPGMSLGFDPMVQFLMVQNDQLAKRLDKAESTLPPTKSHGETSEGSTCAESVADGVSEDERRWETFEAKMKKRQQAEEFLRSELRQLREDLKQLVIAPAPVIDQFSNALPVYSLPSYPDNGTTKRKAAKESMRSFREGLRIVMKICSIILVVVAIVALSRLPGQVGGLLRLSEQKQSDRGMGIYIRW
jgi:hypothetical protein